MSIESFKADSPTSAAEANAAQSSVDPAAAPLPPQTYKVPPASGRAAPWEHLAKPVELRERLTESVTRAVRATNAKDFVLAGACFTEAAALCASLQSYARASRGGNSVLTEPPSDK